MLGRADPDELLAELPAATFLEWQAAYRLQPFGPWRDGLNAAIVARAMVGGKLRDHMPRFGRDPDEWVKVMRAHTDAQDEARRIRAKAKSGK
jgi:hypothetical protein